MKVSNALADVTSGASTLSDVVGPVKSGVKPGVPTDVFGVSADSAATVGWTAPWKPALNGRAAGTTTDRSGSIQYYTVYPDPMPQSTCGDAGDWSTCSALTAAAACDAESSCSWDTTVVEHPHCAVTCTVAVPAISPDATILTGAQTLAGVTAGTSSPKFTTANGGVTATNFGAGDKVVVSTVPGQSQCECAGVYTIASIDASNHWVELTEAVPACTPARCQMDKSAATMAGLTNGVSYRFRGDGDERVRDQ